MTARNVRVIVAAGLFFSALVLAPMRASAAPMPVDQGLARAATATGPIQKTRWVCGPYRCWWRPNYFYGPVYRPWGWRRPYYGWHRPWGWGGGWHHGWRRW